MSTGWTRVSGGKVSHAMRDMDRFSGRELSAHIMGEGSPEERREIEEALAESGELRKEYEFLRRTWEILDRYDVPEPPAHGLGDLHRRIGGTTVVPVRAPRRRVLRRTGWAAAAVLLLATGISLYFTGGSGQQPIGDVIRAITPEVDPVASSGAKGTKPVVASISHENGVRRFLPGEDGNLHAGATIQVNSLAEWSEPVIHVRSMDDLSDLNIEDYAVTNYEFQGAGVSSFRPDIIPVSMDPM
jgi:hypothetical protein